MSPFKTASLQTSYGGIIRIRLKGRSSITSSQPAVQAPLSIFDCGIIIHLSSEKCNSFGQSFFKVGQHAHPKAGCQRFSQPKADGQGFVDPRHCTGIQRTHLFRADGVCRWCESAQAARWNLWKAPQRLQSSSIWVGSLFLSGLAGDGSDDRWTVAICRCHFAR